MPIEERSCCLCCKFCNKHDGSDFQKLLHLKDTGIVIYKYKMEHPNEAILDDVFILHNTKDTDIPQEVFVPEFEHRKVQCPKCKHLLDKTEKILTSVKCLNKNEIRSICEHCRKKMQPQFPCDKCGNAASKFVSTIKKLLEYPKTKTDLKSWIEEQHILKHLIGEQPEHKSDFQSEMFPPDTGKYPDMLSGSLISVQSDTDYYTASHQLNILRKQNPEIFKSLEKKYPDLFCATGPLDLQTLLKQIQLFKTEYPNAFEKIQETHPHLFVPKSEYDRTKRQLDKLREENPELFKHLQGVYPDIFNARAVLDLQKLNQQLELIKTEHADIFQKMQQKHPDIFASKSEYSRIRDQLDQFKKENPALIEALLKQHPDLLNSKNIEDINKLLKLIKSKYPKEFEKIQNKHPEIFKQEPKQIKKDTNEPGFDAAKQELDKFKRENAELFSKLQRQFPELLNEHPENLQKLQQQLQFIKAKQEKTQKDLKETEEKKQRDALEKDTAKPDAQKTKGDKKAKTGQMEKEIAKEPKEKENKLSEKKGGKRSEKDRIGDKKSTETTQAEKTKGEAKKKVDEKETRADSGKEKSKDSGKREVIDKEMQKGTDKGVTQKEKGGFGDKEKAKTTDKEKITDKEKGADSEKQKGRIAETDKGKAVERQKDDSTKTEKDNYTEKGKASSEKEKNKEADKPKAGGKERNAGVSKEKTEPTAVVEKGQARGSDKEREAGAEKDKGVEKGKSGTAVKGKPRGPDKEQGVEKDKSKEKEKSGVVTEKGKTKSPEKDKGDDTEKEKSKGSKKEKGEAAEKGGIFTTDKTIKADKSKSGGGGSERTIADKNKRRSEKGDGEFAKDLQKDMDARKKDKGIKIGESETEGKKSKAKKSESKKSEIGMDNMKSYREKKALTKKSLSSTKNVKQNKKHDLDDDSDMEVDFKHIVMAKPSSEVHQRIFKGVTTSHSYDLKDGVKGNLVKKLHGKEIIYSTKIVKQGVMYDTRKETLLYHTTYSCHSSLDATEQQKTEETKNDQDGKVDNSGKICYTLSDPSFIDKGWTTLPVIKVVRKLNLYRMRPSNPKFNWFERNKQKGLIFYETGEILAEFDGSGSGRCHWYYKNDKLALDYCPAEAEDAGQGVVIYSNGERDKQGLSRPLTVLATFDYLGNGIVYDHAGKIRMKYNQSEGIILDKALGPVTKWKWNDLNDPPVLQQVMVDMHMPFKDPEIIRLGDENREKAFEKEIDEDVLALEFENFLRDQGKKISTERYKSFPITMKALKLNEHFSLRVVDQSHIYLIYRDGRDQLKINLGMTLDPSEIIDTDSTEMGEITNSMERWPARTESVAGLQKIVAHAQNLAKYTQDRQEKINHPIPVPSIDKLKAPASRPLRHPLIQLTPNPSEIMAPCYKTRATTA